MPVTLLVPDGKSPGDQLDAINLALTELQMQIDAGGGGGLNAVDEDGNSTFEQTDPGSNVGGVFESGATNCQITAQEGALAFGDFIGNCDQAAIQATNGGLAFGHMEDTSVLVGPRGGLICGVMAGTTIGFSLGSGGMYTVLAGGNAGTAAYLTGDNSIGCINLGDMGVFGAFGPPGTQQNEILNIVAADAVIDPVGVNSPRSANYLSLTVTANTTISSMKLDSIYSSMVTIRNRTTGGVNQARGMTVGGPNANGTRLEGSIVAVSCFANGATEVLNVYGEGSLLVCQIEDGATLVTHQANGSFTTARVQSGQTLTNTGHNAQQIGLGVNTMDNRFQIGDRVCIVDHLGTGQIAWFAANPVGQRTDPASPAADVNDLKTCCDALRQVFLDYGLTA